MFGTTYPAKVVSREFALRAETTSYHQSERSINISPMVESMAVSKTIAMHVLTKEMEAQGQRVYSLCVGEPDYYPPSAVLEATVRLIKLFIYALAFSDVPITSSTLQQLQVPRNIQQ